MILDDIFDLFVLMFFGGASFALGWVWGWQAAKKTQALAKAIEEKS